MIIESLVSKMKTAMATILIKQMQGFGCSDLISEHSSLNAQPSLCER